MVHRCPVCLYGSLLYPPENHEICPCCGTEFGLDDEQETHLQLRSKWIARGAPWFSHYTLPPPGWSGIEQLADT